MANNPNEWETYHEIPASKYWYFGDKIGAVPVTFFKLWTAFCLILGSALTAMALLTDWLQQTLLFIFLGKAWFIGWFGTPLLIITLYFIRHRKHSPKRQK
jgi:hypothetical protein